MNEMRDYFPKMLTGAELKQKLLQLPKYSQDICNADAGQRLIELNRLSELYLPSQMTEEIYCKLYLSMMRAMEKKMSMDTLKQNLENRKRISGLPSASILGGSDSYSITGPSGIGKSTAIMKTVELAGGGQIIENRDPFQEIIPCVAIQCPHDCSVKGLLLSILRTVDQMIGTKYGERAVRNRSTIDILIGMVSQVAVNHICLLVIDECQNICRNTHGVNLVSALTQLINCSGISICLVGLPETEEYFQREMHLARRSIGLSYTSMPFDEEFLVFCKTLYSYQYVSETTELTPDIAELLYRLSGGVIGIVLALFMEAQQLAILNGSERLTRGTIMETFEKRFRNLWDYVPVESDKHPQTSTRRKRRDCVIQEPDTEAITDDMEDIPVSDSDSIDENDALMIQKIKQSGILVEEVSA